jgi:hypothetical protein
MRKTSNYFGLGPYFYTLIIHHLLPRCNYFDKFFRGFLNFPFHRKKRRLFQKRKVLKRGNRKNKKGVD